MIDSVATPSSQPERSSIGDARARVLSLSSEFLRVLRERQIAGERAAPSRNQAKAFGEEGFFQPAVPWDRDRVATAPDLSSATSPTGTDAGQGGSGGSKHVDTGVSRCSVSQAAACREHAAPVEAAALPQDVVNPAKRLPPTITASASVAPAISAKVAGSEPPGLGNLHVLRQAAAASLPTHVSIQAIERGLAVRVAIGELDSVEQAELMDRIQELLSRHGFAGASISLSGALVTLPSPNQGQDRWR